MLLRAETIGYRLQLHGSDFSNIGTSIKVYKGIVGTIMTLFGYAIKQDIINAEGKIETYAVNKQSLGHYMYRFHKCAISSNPHCFEKMERSYKKTHNPENTSSHAYRYFASEIAKEVHGCRSDVAQTLTDFVAGLEAFKPQALQDVPMNLFYKIKTNKKTIGYLIGTEHLVSEKKSILQSLLQN